MGDGRGLEQGNVGMQRVRDSDCRLSRIIESTGELKMVTEGYRGLGWLKGNTKGHKGSARGYL